MPNVLTNDLPKMNPDAGKWRSITVTACHNGYIIREENYNHGPGSYNPIDNSYIAGNKAELYKVINTILIDRESNQGKK